MALQRIVVISTIKSRLLHLLQYVNQSEEKPAASPAPVGCRVIYTVTWVIASPGLGIGIVSLCSKSMVEQFVLRVPAHLPQSLYLPVCYSPVVTDDIAAVIVPQLRKQCRSHIRTVEPHLILIQRLVVPAAPYYSVTSLVCRRSVGDFIFIVMIYKARHSISQCSLGM